MAVHHCKCARRYLRRTLQLFTAGTGFEPHAASSSTVRRRSTALAAAARLPPASPSNRRRSLSSKRKNPQLFRTPHPWLRMMGRHWRMVEVGSCVICSASSANLMASCDKLVEKG